jgi:glycosyltransferase involved in cell wall biosynthesis
LKVAFLFLHPFHGSLGSTKRVEELCISLSKFGVKSCILTPYEKSQTLSEGVEVVCISDIIQKLKIGNFIYGSTKNAYYNPFFMRHLMIKQGLSGFLTSELSNKIANLIERLGVDLVQVEQDIILIALAKKIEKLKLPLVVDIHNITTEELVAVNTIRKNSKEFDVLEQQSRYAFSLTDSVVVVSNEMRDYVIAKHDISPARVVVVPPGGRPRINEVVEKPYAPRVIYSGLVANRENVDLFIRSMRPVLKKLPIAEFYITKRGRALRRMKGLAKKVGVKPSFFWIRDKTKFYEFLESCHIGVLPSSNDLARKMGTPVKLFDYLSAGLPVVANDIGTWTNIITEEKVGLVTKGDEADFASGILRLLEDSEFAIKCGQKGIELVKNKYNWDNSAKILLNEYHRLLNA